MIYSQNDEQQYIEEFFKGTTGHFLDIGAFDGQEFSNTRRLLELGWFGAMFEPDPFNVVNIFKNCKDHIDSLEVFNMAVSNFDGVRELYLDDTEGRGWGSTINTELAAMDHIQKPSRKKLFVSVLNVASIRIKTFKFISIDAEWEDENILFAMTPKILEGCQLICVEPRDPASRIRIKSKLADMGFTVSKETPENVMAHKI